MPQYYISSNKYSLQERQTKKHGKVYDVRFRIVSKDGAEIHKKLSNYANKTLAKQAYLDFVSEYCEPIKNNPIVRQKKIEQGKITPTIKDLSIIYFQSVRNQIKDSSIYDLQNVFKLRIFPKYENSQLKDLTKQELTLWQDNLWSTKNPKTNEYYSYKYLCKIRMAFSSFLSWCSERYDGCTNHFLTIKKPKKRTQKTEMLFWERKTFEKFISVVDDASYKTLFAILFFTGRRKGEVLALSPADVKENEIIFNKSLTRKTLDGTPYNITSTKAEKKANSPICKPLKEILKNYSPPNGKFFFGGDKPIAENTLTRVFNRYCELAGVKSIRLHDLRHSFVSMIISLGANITVVADLIGDNTQQIFQTYGHLYRDDIAKVMEKI